MTDCIVKFDTDNKTLIFIDPETDAIVAEIPTGKKTSAPKKKKEVEPESSDPKLTLSENKVTLNSAAIDVLGVEAGDYVAIGFVKQDRKLIPAIGIPEVMGTKGNKLTKSNTIACKGKANDELANYGSEFNLIPNPNGTTSFLLISESMNVEDSYTEDESINQEPDEEIIDKLESIVSENIDNIEIVDSSDLMSLINA